MQSGSAACSYEELNIFARKVAEDYVEQDVSANAIPDKLTYNISLVFLVCVKVRWHP